MLKALMTQAALDRKIKCKAILGGRDSSRQTCKSSLPVLTLSLEVYIQTAVGTSGESIINALTTGTEAISPHVRSRGAGLRSISSAPDDRAYAPRFRTVAVDDKAEVSEGQPVPRQLSYDEAVNQAFPDDMFAQELANGIESGDSHQSC